MNVQTLPIHITPIGILVALVFAITVGSTLYWMLKIQGTITRGISKTERALISQKGPVVVGISPDFMMPNAVYLGATLAKERKVPLLLLSVIELPFTLPPGAVMPQQQALAEAALKEAKHLAKELGLEDVETRLVSARAASKAIINETEEFGGATIVIGAREKRREGIWFGSTAEHVLRNARCEVIVARAA